MKGSGTILTRQKQIHVDLHIDWRLQEKSFEQQFNFKPFISGYADYIVHHHWELWKCLSTWILDLHSIRCRAKHSSSRSCSPKLHLLLPSRAWPSKLAILISNFHVYPITTSPGFIYHQGEIVISLAACMGRGQALKQFILF